MCYENSAMEKIDPQHDHLKLEQYRPGQRVLFRGNTYTIQRRTTLASGEAAVVLQGDKDQFVVGANQFFAEIK
jgi:lipopolysaccharide export system protein LptA